jgi:cell wall-associated NlpC family hydrolase
MGQTVVDRALQWIGTPYAWAGGSASGPTLGECASGGAQNDCHISGFDCSGLTLYSWAPYLTLDHSAAVQYATAGTQHPAINKLRPGDLVFWSSDGTAAGIHHVALYVGLGLVLQAPQSGDIVRITPLLNVDSGLFGATRPLT